VLIIRLISFDQSLKSTYMFDTTLVWLEYSVPYW